MYRAFVIGAVALLVYVSVYLACSMRFTYGQGFHGSALPPNESASSEAHQQLEHAVLLNKLKSLKQQVERQVTSLGELHEDMEWLQIQVTNLEGRVEDLEEAVRVAQNFSNEVANIQAKNDQVTEAVLRNMNEWLEILDSRTRDLHVRLIAESEYRTLKPVTNWHFQRLIEMLRAQHAILQADHFTLGLNLARKTPTGKLQPRRGYELQLQEPNPFPPPVVN